MELQFCDAKFLSPKKISSKQSYFSPGKIENQIVMKKISKIFFKLEPFFFFFDFSHWKT